MQQLALTDSRLRLSRTSGKTFAVAHSSRNLYRVLQDQVELGVQALKREDADMAITSLERCRELTPESECGQIHEMLRRLRQYKASEP